MSTRAQVRFATREDGVSFSEHPEKINAQFYVHSDGYPTGLGLEIAESLTNYGKIHSWEMESLGARHGDLEYIYYIWQAEDKATWISIFEVGWEQPCECCGSIKTEDQWKDNCIFVGEPYKLIEKYDRE
jgi:hypothetical protein